MHDRVHDRFAECLCWEAGGVGLDAPFWEFKAFWEVIDHGCEGAVDEAEDGSAHVVAGGEAFFRILDPSFSGDADVVDADHGEFTAVGGSFPEEEEA